MSINYTTIKIGGLSKELASDYAAIEPPVWSSLIANYLRKNFTVKILDAEAEFLNHEQTAKE